MRIVAIVSLLAAAGLAFLIGYSLNGPSPSSLPYDPEYWPGSEAQINDAYRRWAIKTGEAVDSVKETWFPQLTFVPTHNQDTGLVA